MARSQGRLDLALFAAIGALALVGHFLFTAAYRHAPASTLAPVNYLHLAWAGLLGWLVFNHLPDGWSLLGMALVAGSGAPAALYAHLSTKPNRVLYPADLARLTAATKAIPIEGARHPQHLDRTTGL